MDASSLVERKAALRREQRRLRARHLRLWGAQAAQKARDRFLAAFGDSRAPVALFHALPRELSTEPLARALNERGVALCLPVVVAAGQALEFRAWVPGEPLAEGAFGVREPVEGAEVVRPRTLLLPLLAFDEEGRRLGYGGGYYDRTLRALREAGPVVAIGWALEVQRVDRVPTLPGDEPVDAIVTDVAARWIAKPARGPGVSSPR